MEALIQEILEKFDEPDFPSVDISIHQGDFIASLMLEGQLALDVQSDDLENALEGLLQEVINNYGE
ncbi:hypothetical protein Ac42p234 [Acinetobacter phage Ac42]|uniref:hypothetical protein n=1 Tax=Acinetobacter phage Ac42 TaxID=762660 RepID=UPI0001EBCE12|nr:hypothetical protein Ac42p234 [Acinetobacter phage Ac42]ADI96470.1 hypothetical protein Ac42p234 [Acinetobacter phage Ac42]